MPLHRLITAATGNHILELFVDVLSEVVPIQLPAEERTAPRARSIAEDTHRAHGRIVEAIVAGDPERAERNMLRHLRASVGVLQNV